MQVNILFETGSVKKSLLGNSKPEFNTSILPYIIISSFADASDFNVTQSNFSCNFSSQLAFDDIVKIICSKIAESQNESVTYSPISNENEACLYKVGTSSSLKIYSFSDNDEIVDIENDMPSELAYDYQELKTLCDSTEELVGCDSLKSYFHNILKIAPRLNDHNNVKELIGAKSLMQTIQSQCYLLSINDGCGLTNIVERLTLLGKYLGAYSSDRYYEYVLGNETVGRKITLSDIIPYFGNEECEGMLICLDISAYTGKNTQSELKNLLIEISQNVHKVNVVFRVPYLEPNELKRIENMISDILLLKTFVIPPFTNEQLVNLAKKQLDEFLFTMDESAIDVFNAKVRDEKIDGCFYGVRTIQKIVNEILLLKLAADANKEESQRDNIIKSEDIATLASTSQEGNNDPYAELDEMIGMDQIKKRIEEIVAQVKIAISNNKLDKPALHMRFVGAPGTGKTTVARIIGKIFAQNGILTNGHFFEYSGRDLCGSYIGQTAPKTLSICRDAYGSILFLDEAYELYTSENNDNDYGHEALATLIAEMENHRDNFVVIMAGYKKAMETLMHGNAGLRSRMPFVIEFKSYTREQLVLIFMSMLKKHFKHDDNVEEKVTEYFNSLSDSFINSEEFANARFVRNLYERTWSKAAMRTQMNGNEDLIICANDFVTASQEKEFREKLSTSHNRVGF